MYKGRHIVKWIIGVVVFTFLYNGVFAQPGSVKIEYTVLPDTKKEAPVQQSQLSQARMYSIDKNYDKSLPIYGELYGVSPDSVYLEYVNTLLDAKKFNDAEKVVEKQMLLHPQDFSLHIDLGTVYLRERKNDRAREQFDMVLKMINGDDMFTQRIAKAFSDAGNDDYAIMTYERAGQLLNYPSYYSGPLAKLYAKCGDLGRAIDMLLVPIPGMGLNVENVKTVLLELVGDDAAKLQLTQKALITKINESPENVFYAELLTWIYTQKNDWDGALIQMEAVDDRNNEGGKHIIDLARTAANAKQYDVAVKAYDEIIAKGKEQPYYIIAKSERLSTGLAQLHNNPAYKPEDVAALRTMYDSFLVEFPKYYSQQTAADFATLEAQYDNNVQRAIDILQKGLKEPDTRRNMAGKFKLQLGDYYVLIGRLWEASLTYSQVDKEFKQDNEGEDARFRNAKLAYYRGDFDWAQRQLLRLKSATSELISNDAIYLSVLITENVEDSNIVPLQRFAYAGLLLFQNKDKDVETLLDSINKAYPKHPLNDDILMMRADIAIKHRDYPRAIGFLTTIYKEYGEDVLGDDAVYKLAEIYLNDLHQIDQAKHFYEQLIIDYPGSTYVQTARQKLAELNKGILP